VTGRFHGPAVGSGAGAGVSCRNPPGRSPSPVLLLQHRNLSLPDFGDQLKVFAPDLLPLPSLLFQHWLEFTKSVVKQMRGECRCEQMCWGGGACSPCFRRVSVFSSPSLLGSIPRKKGLFDYPQSCSPGSKVGSLSTGPTAVAAGHAPPARGHGAPALAETGTGTIQTSNQELPAPGYDQGVRPADGAAGASPRLYRGHLLPP